MRKKLMAQLFAVSSASFFKRYLSRTINQILPYILETTNRNLSKKAVAFFCNKFNGVFFSDFKDLVSPKLG
jgi:hypothetical protein